MKLQAISKGRVIEHRAGFADLEVEYHDPDHSQGNLFLPGFAGKPSQAGSPLPRQEVSSTTANPHRLGLEHTGGEAHTLQFDTA